MQPKGEKESKQALYLSAILEKRSKSHYFTAHLDFTLKILVHITVKIQRPWQTV